MSTRVGPTLSVELDLPVQMRDGTRLAADVYRPAGGGRWPVVLVRTPYDRRIGLSTAQHVNAVQLASAGYAVVVQDVRGRFGSEGDFTPFADEAQDGVDTIAWVAEQAWSTGSVGMVGTSYTGYTQVLAAKERPEALKAWFPGFTTLDVRAGWVYEGEAFSLGFNLVWTLGAIASRDRRTRDLGPIAAALDAWPETVRRAIGDQPALASTEAAAYYAEWIERRDDAVYWRSMSGKGVGACEAPAVQIGGWFDLFASGTFALHEELATGAAADWHRLIVGPWDHSPLPLGTGSGETDFGVAAAFDLAGAQRQWFDWLLREESEPDWPAARMFITGWNRWEEWPGWPPAHRAERLFLQPGGGLGALPDRATEVRFETDAEDPTPTVGGRLFGAPDRLMIGQRDQRLREARGDVRSFTSEPVSRDLLLAGPVSAVIWSSSSAAVGDVFLTLVDVAPEGRAVNLVEGIRRRVMSGSASVRFDVALGQTGHAVLAGHRLRLDVSGMSFPRFDRCPSSGRATRMIALGGELASFVTLPIN